MRACSALAETPCCAVMWGMHLEMDHEDRWSCGEAIVLLLHKLMNMTELYNDGQNTQGLNERKASR